MFIETRFPATFGVGLREIVLAAALSIAVAGCSDPAEVSPAGPVERKQTAPDLTGFWELRHDSKENTEADLHPAAAKRWQEMLERRTRRRDLGNIFPPDHPHCSSRGNLGGMGDSAPMAVIQSAREIVVFFETNAAPRHIYMDGRDWPDPKTLEASTTGYSIGRWEGNTLVIETRGFHPSRGQPAPGGYTLKTRVTERWHLIDDAEKLQIDWTFEEPTVYKSPYQVTWTYYRPPADLYAAELLCDASDPAQFLTVQPE